MILRPQNRDELLQQLRDHFSRGEKISSVDLSALKSIVEHSPEDMTASVEAGLTLAAFQDHLRASRQWLPIDPPHPQALSIGDLLAHDLSGSRRLGYGTIRDYLIGIKVALADGTLIKAGGKVVKNVAGYDLCKLFVGARHSLGVIVEATFKLRPLPETEIIVSANVSSLQELEKLRTALLNSRAEPVLFDAIQYLSGPITVWAGFAGNREDVDAQVQIATSLGFKVTSELSPHYFLPGDSHKTSVLPSRIIATLQQLQVQPIEFLAHLGNGIIFHRGEITLPPPRLPTVLMNRVKKAYDPKNILPEYSA